MPTISEQFAVPLNSLRVEEMSCTGRLQRCTCRQGSERASKSQGPADDQVIRFHTLSIHFSTAFETSQKLRTIGAETVRRRLAKMSLHPTNLETIVGTAYCLQWNTDNVQKLNVGMQCFQINLFSNYS